MANKNDNRIMELKDTIQSAKKSIKVKRFQPTTNCLLGLNGTAYNLHVCSEDELKILLVILHSYEMSAKDLGIEIPDMQGFSIGDWVQDIKDKLEIMQMQSKKSELSKTEKQLDKLLSEDKRTELEISSLEEALKGLI